MLEIEDLHVRYGPIKALHGVSLRVEEGEFVGLVGPNGAGKSSLLWTITGVVPAERGAVRVSGRAILGRKPEHIVRDGLALVPERRHVLTRLTVAENLRLGTTIVRDKAAARKDIARLFERFPVLGERRDQPAGQLSGGEQQQLVIARALLSRPKVLMLDEPSLGLAPLVVDRVFELLAELREQGTTVLLVEQNVTRTVAAADRSYVFRGGRVELHGTREELTGRADLVEAYLGKSKGDGVAAVDD